MRPTRLQRAQNRPLIQSFMPSPAGVFVAALGLSGWGEGEAGTVSGGAEVGERDVFLLHETRAGDHAVAHHLDHRATEPAVVQAMAVRGSRNVTGLEARTNSSRCSWPSMHALGRHVHVHHVFVDRRLRVGEDLAGQLAASRA